jgi:hypothetical protein
MAKDQHVPDPAIVAIFDEMISAVPGVARKGATVPYLSMNGNMYASISKMDVIGLRLSKPDHAAFLEQYENGLFEPFAGFFQKEYVAVPVALHDDMAALQGWFKTCHAHDAEGLKPKATKKKKPT